MVVFCDCVGVGGGWLVWLVCVFVVVVGVCCYFYVVGWEKVFDVRFEG